MLAKNGAHREDGTLIIGHTFGSAVAEARRVRRIRVQALLEAIDRSGRLTPDVWNEVEQDRHDPAILGEDVLRALAAALDVNYEALQTLAGKHYAARLEERKIWSLLSEEAHAFRRRRGRD